MQKVSINKTTGKNLNSSKQQRKRAKETEKRDNKLRTDALEVKKRQ
jgi:hypothetical protein